MGNHRLIFGNEGSLTEVIEQIQNLPCLYGLLDRAGHMLIMEMQDDEGQLHSILPLYSSFELALEGLDQLGVLLADQVESFIVQWTDVHEVIEVFHGLEIDGMGFDVLEVGNEIRGVILDHDTVDMI